jgi:hypothetical protein
VPARAAVRLPPSVALFGDDAGHRNLAELPDLLRSDLLPTLDMFDTRTRLASEYDVRRSFAFSCMEWAVHKGDVDAARALLTRYLDAHPAAGSRRDDARGAGLLRGSVCRRSRRRDARSGKKPRP